MFGELLVPHFLMGLGVGKGTKREPGPKRPALFSLLHTLVNAANAAMVPNAIVSAITTVATNIVIRFLIALLTSLLFCPKQITGLHRLSCCCGGW